MADSDRIIPPLTDAVILDCKAKAKRVYTIIAARGDDPEGADDQHVIIRSPSAEAMRRAQVLAQEEKGLEAVRSLVADCLLFPDLATFKKFSEEYPLVPQKIFEQASKIARGEIPDLAKKV